MKNIILVCIALVANGVLFAQSPNKVFIPPVEDWDVSYESFTWNMESCGKFVSASGARICAPANALVDANGNDVTGDVKLLYREFLSPIDIMRAGINMTYRHDGKTDHLETGGMFEIRAKQNGQELRIKEGEEITVQFPGFFDDPEMQFFQYDERGDTWELENGGLVERIPVKRAEDNNQAIQEETDDDDLWGDFVDADQDDFGSNNENNTADFQGDWGDGWGDDWFGEGIYDTAWFEVQKFNEELRYAAGIQDFGYYNYDKIIKMDDNVRIIANFECNTSDTIGYFPVYVIYKDINSVFSFSKYNWEENFYLFKDKEAKIYTLLPDKKVALFPEQQLASMDIAALKDKKHTFTLDVVSQALDNPQAMKDILNCN